MPYRQNPRLDPNILKIKRATIKTVAPQLSAGKSNDASTNDTTYFTYVGKSPKSYSAGETFTIYAPHTQWPTGAITYAEVGLYIGDWNPTLGSSVGSITLTRNAWLNASTWYTDYGLTSKIVIPAAFTLTTPIRAGDGIWYAYGTNAASTRLGGYTMVVNALKFEYGWKATSSKPSDYPTITLTTSSNVMYVYGPWTQGE